MARVSAQPVDESRLKFVKASDNIVYKNQVRENLAAPTFDGSYEVQTVKPDRKAKFQRPDIRNGDLTQYYSADILSLERGATEAAAIRELLRKWNAGKQPEPEPVMKIVIQRKTLEKRR
jgi:hypothetical protein